MVVLRKGLLFSDMQHKEPRPAVSHPGKKWLNEKIIGGL